MWTRSNLKMDAKQHLQGRYWSAFAVALITMLIGGGGGGAGSRYNFDTSDFNRNGNWGNWGNGTWQNMQDFLRSLNWPMIALIISGVVAAIIFGILFTIFVSSVIEAGSARWFSRSREMANPPSIGFMFSLFKAGSYMSTVSAQFWRYLFLFLWSLIPVGFSILGAIALFVPMRVVVNGARAQGDWINTVGPIMIVVFVLGNILLSLIVANRFYAYRMVPWILGDNPKVGKRQALNLSKEMTRGHKFDMFVLDLSFIGWFLLGVLACGVGVLFVMPYYQATWAELYDRLRGLSVEKGIARMEDYGFVRVEQ